MAKIWSSWDGKSQIKIDISGLDTDVKKIIDDAIKEAYRNECHPVASSDRLLNQYKGAGFTIVEHKPAPWGYLIISPILK